MKLIADAKKKLNAVAEIFSKRDSGTRCEVTVSNFTGKVASILEVKTTKEPFDAETDRQLLLANLDLQGGFTNARVLIDDSGKTMRLTAIYTGASDKGFHYGEVTIGDLVKFIKDHSANFPRGMKTKLSLGDFEGNTYHRKISIGTDDGRLHLSYELHERAS